MRLDTEVTNALGRVGFFETLSIIIAVLFLSGVALQATRGYQVDVEERNSLRFAVQAFVYLSMLPFVIRYRKLLVERIRNEKVVWTLVALAFVSAIWSQFPVNTLKQSMLLLATTVFGMYFGARFSPKEQIRLLGWALSVALILSYLVAIFAPDYGIMNWEHIGAWRGIYPHRNALARMMVLAALVFMLRARTTDGYRVWSYAGLVGAMGLILLSGSQTGLIIMILLLVLALLSPILRWRRSRLVAAIAGVVGLAWFAGNWLVNNWVDVIRSLGRDPAISGRFYLWGLVVLKALRRPWFGYGYSGFWFGLEGESASIWKALRWPTPNAHNGFLDLWLNLGLIGLLVFLLSYLNLARISFAHVRASTSLTRFWPLLYLFFYFIYNIDESNLVQHNSLLWALYVALGVSLIAPDYFYTASRMPTGITDEHAARVVDLSQQ